MTEVYIPERAELEEALERIRQEGGCDMCQGGLIPEYGDYGQTYGADYCSCAYGRLLEKYDDAVAAR